MQCFLHHAPSHCFHIDQVIIPLRNHLETIFLIQAEGGFVAAPHLDTDFFFIRPGAFFLDKPDNLF